MQINATAIGSFAASAALGPYLRVKRDATNGLVVAGPEDRELGTLRQRHIVSGVGATANAPVVFANAPGTVKMVAAGALSKWDVVYGAEGGKVDDAPNGNPIGIALDATTADGDYLEVLRLPNMEVSGSDQVGGLEIFDDFLGDWPAAGVAITGSGAGWTKTETNGLGVTSVDVANGVLAFAADAVVEAATAALYMANSPVDIDENPIVDFRISVEDNGDDAAVDFDWGLASDTHATDFEAIATFAAFHLDGNTLDLDVHSDDGTNDVAPTDTTVNLVASTYYEFRIDVSDKSDVKFYYRADGANAWTALLASTTFDISNYSGNLTPIIMVEKTSNDSTFALRADWARIRAGRSL